MTQPNPTTIKCWHCGVLNAAGAITCTECNHLQPPRHVDAFTLFEMQPSFAMDEAALEKKYLALQQQLHPDRYATSSTKEQRFATAHSLAVNEAYDVLSTALGRAEYLLARAGLIVNRDGRDAVKASQMLLIESLEAREALSDAKDSQGLRQMQQNVKQQRQACVNALEVHFGASAWQEAAQETIRLKYLLKLEQEIKAKKRQLTASH